MIFQKNLMRKFFSSFMMLLNVGLYQTGKLFSPLIQPNKFFMSSESKKILYIEDDFANRQLVRLILERQSNYELIEAEDGTTGLQKAEQHQPDLILLDLSLPDISGYTVLKRLQENPDTIAIPVIAVSGDNLPDDRQKGLQAGFIDYLGKPISVGGLSSAIDGILTDG